MADPSPKLCFTIAANGMQAFARPAPNAPDGHPLAPEEIQVALRNNGVVFGLRPDALAQVADAFLSCQPAGFRILVAEGVAPQHAKPPDVCVLFTETQLVAKGDTLARLEGGSPARPGMTVRGEEVPSPPSREQGLSCGPHVEFCASDRTFRAQAAGYPVKDRQQIQVIPFVRIEPDHMRASVLLRKPTSDAAALTEPVVRKLLADAGVVFGFDKHSFTRLTNALNREAWSEQLVEVAVGQFPVHGTDASIRWAAGSDIPVGRQLENERIDFHKQCRNPSVAAGELLATKSPATTGVPGVSVTGEFVPATNGRDCCLEAGENIQISQDGLRFTAAIDGVLHRSDNRLWVTELLEVRGDVDFSTGDLDCPGSILIRGTVRSTFTVRARGVIQVRESIEDAVVESFASVEVERGIIHRTIGSLSVRDRVTARYAQNAQIHAGNSILIRDSAMHCILVASNSVTVLGGAGTVIGGRAAAGRLVEVKVAGSPMNVPTVLQAGVNFKCLSGVEERLRRIQQKMARLLALHGEKLLKFISGESKPPADRHVQDDLSTWRNCERKKKELLQERAGLFQHAADAEAGQPSVLVHEKIYPGVKIIIADASLLIQEQTSGGRFRLDPQTRGITCVPPHDPELTSTVSDK